MRLRLQFQTPEYTPDLRNSPKPDLSLPGMHRESAPNGYFSTYFGIIICGIVFDYAGCISCNLGCCSASYFEDMCLFQSSAMLYKLSLNPRSMCRNDISSRAACSAMKSHSASCHHDHLVALFLRVTHLADESPRRKIHRSYLLRHRCCVLVSLCFSGQLPSKCSLAWYMCSTRSHFKQTGTCLALG